MKRFAAILCSLALSVPAVTIVVAPDVAQAQRCSGCGCKGGPGWRSKRTGVNASANAISLENADLPRHRQGADASARGGGDVLKCLSVDWSILSA
jgi:hypothetical protein